MKKYIRVGSTSTELIPVSEVYAFIYDGGLGKKTLRMYIDKKIKGYDELYLLFNDGVDKVIYEYNDIENEETGEVIESEVLQHVYEHFCENYSCCYNGGENYLDYPDHFYIEITQKAPEKLEAELFSEKIAESNVALASIYESSLM